MKVYKLEKTYLESYVNYWCLRRETPILIKQNKKIKKVAIEKLCNMKDYEVGTYNLSMRDIEFKKPEKTIMTKKEAQVYRLTLENKKSIVATIDHPFLTKNGYKRMFELMDNDLIVCNNGSYGIKKITKLEKKVPVFDIIGVPDNHNFIANGMVVHNCDLFGRGVGAIYVKDKNPVHDSWRLKEFATIAHYTEFTNIEKVEKELKKHPNFWTIVRFPKLPAWLYNKYLSVREKNIYDDDNVFRSITKEDINNALLILTLRDLMAVDNSVTMNRLLLHIKNTHDISLTKSAIDNAVNDAKQLILKIKEKAVSYEDK
jgi:hypothetical protein